ncbi:HAMP domain-containing histidine kinase [Streptomyces sp. PSKA54]|uniref:histidine kinase n=1 Tax=Streptomyces himalayensis subsp. aureolus TaxID=2758039 RepID=A0A7W2HHT3_9ACTN|nr:HAMP domain-containing sensor histidine kinase [Streptomyces himalayensis]MBA4864330.1 HAMP domain-containing histidine kinase [Streptomyces himalayensis subsp. aureolus]
MTYRLLRSYLTLAALVLVALVWPLGHFYIRSEQTRAIASLEHDAEALAAFADHLIETDSTDRLPRLARENAARTGGRVVVVDSTGRLFAAWPPLEPGEAAGLSTRPEIATALRGGSRAGVRRERSRRGELVHLAVPTRPGPAVRGAVRLTVPGSSVDGNSGRVWGFLALVGAAVLALAAVAAVALARWIGRPVRYLEETAARIAAGGDLVVPERTVSGPPELRRLTETLRTTARRLQYLLTAQGAFAGEASHQLRTPLAALRLRLENLERDVAPRSLPDWEAALTETDRLARTTETLLAMARLDEASLEPEPLDLDAAVARHVRTWAPLAAESGVRLTASGGPVGRVWAVPGGVEQVLDNLLANAVRAAPPGSTVVVHRLARRPRRGLPPIVELHVVDQGPGLDAAQRERAFDRFWRAPDAPKGGTGLGLPLVRQLARASGGEALLLPAPGRGLDATVVLRPVTESVNGGHSGGSTADGQSGASARVSAVDGRHGR